jgi:hypothetical protein
VELSQSARGALVGRRCSAGDAGWVVRACRGKIPSGMRGCARRHDLAGGVWLCPSVARRAEKGAGAVGGVVVGPGGPAR